LKYTVWRFNALLVKLKSILLWFTIIVHEGAQSFEHLVRMDKFDSLALGGLCVTLFSSQFVDFSINVVNITTL